MQILDRFIVLEGLDGAGTTTQLGMLDSLLAQQKRPHVMEAEPTDGPVGKLVRSILQHTYSVQPWTLAMLYAADRNEHVQTITKEIEAGKLVVCDRYLYSSLAYQGVTCPWDDVWRLNCRFPLPSLILYVDTPVEECMRRIKHRGQPEELFEHREFLRKVQAGYERSFGSLPKGVRLVRLDGVQDPDVIFQHLRDALGI